MSEEPKIQDTLETLTAEITEKQEIIDDLFDRLGRSDDELSQVLNMTILDMGLKYIFPNKDDYMRLIALKMDSLTDIEQNIKNRLYNKYVEAKKLVSFIETNVFEDNLESLIMRKEHEEQFNREHPD